MFRKQGNCNTVKSRKFSRLGELGEQYLNLERQEPYELYHHIKQQYLLIYF